MSKPVMGRKLPVDTKKIYEILTLAVSSGSIDKALAKLGQGLDADWLGRLKALTPADLVSVEAATRKLNLHKIDQSL